MYGRPFITHIKKRVGGGGQGNGRVAAGSQANSEEGSEAEQQEAQVREEWHLFCLSFVHMP